jgi:hypothetical protein
MSFNETDIKIYKACLEILKNGLDFNVSSLARYASVERKTIYNKFEKHTFQDLEKYRNKTL